MGVPEILSEVAKLSTTERRWLVASIQAMPLPPRQPKAATDTGQPSEEERARAGKPKGPAKKESAHARNPLYQAFKQKEKSMKEALSAVSSFEGEDKSFGHLLEVMAELLGDTLSVTGEKGRQTAQDRLSNATAMCRLIPTIPDEDKPVQWKETYNNAFNSLSELERSRIAWIFRDNGPQSDPVAEPRSEAGPSSSQGVTAQQDATPAQQENPGQGESPGKGRLGKGRSGRGRGGSNPNA
jgi:hypothetical protein